MLSDMKRDAESVMLREMAHDFAERILRPAGNEADKSGETPWRAVRAAGEVGLSAANVPDRYGGPGVKPTVMVSVMEELGWGNFGIAATIGAASLVAAAVLRAGGEDQRQRYLGHLCSTEAPWVGALALTEPESGSELEIDLPDAPQRLSTSAKRTPTGYRLSGSKRFITNGGRADLTLVLANIGPQSDRGGWSLFLVEQGTAGLRAGRQIPTMGLRGSYTGELWLEDCDVPASALLGQPGEGLRIVLEVLQLARTMIAAALVGLARAAFEAARAYSLERRQFGAPIREHQLVGETIARMRLEVDAARLLVLRAASELEVGRDASLSAAEAKLYASETAVKVTQAALQLHGGYGFTQELPLEMWVRDAMVGRIFFGTSEMQLLEIARSIDRD